MPVSPLNSILHYRSIIARVMFRLFAVLIIGIGMQIVMAKPWGILV